MASRRRSTGRRPPSSARTATTSPVSPASATRPPPSGSAVRRPRRDHRPGRRDQGQGRRERAGPPRRRHAQLRAQRSGRRPGPADHPRRAAVARLGPRGGPPGLRRPGVPDPARPALPVSRRRRAGGRERLRPGRQRAARGGRRLARPSTRRPAPGSASPSPGKFGRGTGEVTGIGLAAADGPAAWFDPTELDAADDAGAWRPGSPPDDRPKVLHDAKPARLAFGARGWDLQGVASDTALEAYLARPDQRSYELADLALRYLKRELRVDDRRTTASSRWTAWRGRPGRPRRTSCCAPAPPSTWPRRSPASCAATASRARLLAEVELPLVTVLAEMERVGIAADTDYLTELESSSPARSRPRPRAPMR